MLLRFKNERSPISLTTFNDVNSVHTKVFILLQRCPSFCYIIYTYSPHFDNKTLNIKILKK
jgi:hypothetical protein